MPFLVCEPDGDSCEAIEISRTLPEAASVIHAHVMMASTEDEPVTLSNSFIALRPMKNERDLPGSLPRNWSAVYGAYLVRIGEPSITLDAKIYVLEF